MPTQPVAGVWKRLWEEDPLGDADTADRTTLVLWTQSPHSGIYVDLRLPQGAPGRSLAEARAAGFEPLPSALEARGLSIDPSKLSDELVDSLYRQKSFAGQLQYTVGDTTSGEALAKDAPLAQLAENAESDKDSGALGLCTCFWRRDIDYQPPSGGLDVGVCASSPPNADGSIDLRETGDDASYAEGWHRLPGSADGPSFAMKLLSENGVERTGLWVRMGDQFAYAVGRPKEPETARTLGCHEECASVQNCVGKSLAEVAKSITTDIAKQMQIVVSYVAVYGHVSKEADWTILHSTDPRLVGCCLVGSALNDICCSILSVDGGKKKLDAGDIVYQSLVGSNGVVRKWEVAEMDGTSNLPGFA